MTLASRTTLRRSMTVLLVVLTLSLAVPPAAAQSTGDPAQLQSAVDAYMAGDRDTCYSELRAFLDASTPSEAGTVNHNVAAVVCYGDEVASMVLEATCVDLVTQVRYATYELPDDLQRTLWDDMGLGNTLYAVCYGSVNPPSAEAPPVHGADVCAGMSPLVYAACNEAMTGSSSQSRIWYTTTKVDSDTLDPTFHARGVADHPGTWTLRAESHIESNSVLGGGWQTVSGSHRSITCSFTVGVELHPNGACQDHVDNVDITPDSYTAYRWVGSYELVWTDPAGEDHVMERGSDSGYF